VLANLANPVEFSGLGGVGPVSPVCGRCHTSGQEEQFYTESPEIDWGHVS
jgi:hypothetical protein